MFETNVITNYTIQASTYSSNMEVMDLWKSFWLTWPNWLSRNRTVSDSSRRNEGFLANEFYKSVCVCVFWSGFDSFSCLCQEEERLHSFCRRRGRGVKSKAMDMLNQQQVLIFLKLLLFTGIHLNIWTLFILNHFHRICLESFNYEQTSQVKFVW